ncbi:tubulin polyglutamylase complex subunit 2 isoform X6 [Indicator indicator]|uniref:tubulin polyglutamylase complex subunit 2 isoform X6 n=1 Tax=Indicator indicator TaxID=1002788 RepID=UPI0023E04602|nr:tubulin polyglutamylase complex subunit 2 isoform X6 [Indicator indicator]
MEEKPSTSIKPYQDKLTLGVTRILETSPGVAEVTFVEKEPAERHTIISWEQKNSCILPEDLKNFYLMTNGFQMSWSVKTNGNEDKPGKPHFDSRSLIFELDPCNGNGKVCLVYKQAKPVVSPDTEIWFLDRALYWHFLTKTFTAYYRLLITHLGLPQWQYAFTSYGVSPQAKQWFNMYKPITINTALLSEEADCFVNKLDPNKVFKSKNKTPVIKKKSPSQPAGSQKSHTSMTSSKTSSLAGNSSRK